MGCEPNFYLWNLKVTRGKRKIGILSNPWEAGVTSKYMWHFIGEQIPSGKLSVIAVKKDTNEISKALVIPDTEQQEWVLSRTNVGSAVNNHTDVPSGMKLPTSGMWALNAYINEELYGQIIVDVKGEAAKSEIGDKEFPDQPLTPTFKFYN
ncbi:DUF4871 domain-containing protein [Peribacillus deserti]|uniref:Uncharacterized protein n=1 Tax=Peribacillus deserti TaxID=673318 RepID=A0A2N5LZH7_9BACI|nr:DUF4871 domain-containing protein [Peribacillus deserti]PLT27508.1 hypothetical protein CUU66_23495 [Peribacillus deserti]